MTWFRCLLWGHRWRIEEHRFFGIQMRTFWYCDRCRSEQVIDPLPEMRAWYRKGHG